jgi:soluble lytic murein transglycosylase
MKIHKRLKPSAISLIIIISLVLMTFTLIQAFSEEDRQKEFVVRKTVQFLKDKKVKGSEEKLKIIANTVYEESRVYDLDYRLVLAVMKVESNFRHDAVSRDGSRGLLQIKPSLAKHISKKTGIPMTGAKSLHEPEKNIKIGVNHLSWLVDKFEHLSTALHAYNAGPGKIKSTRSEEAEGQGSSTRFTRRVLKEYDEIAAILPDPDAE